MNKEQMQLVAELYAENDRLENQNKLLDKKLHELQQGNNQLKEQRQKLRSWLEEIIPYLKVHGIRTTPDKVLEDVLDKLNELESGKNE